MNKYLVINNNGDFCDPKEFLKSKGCSKDFKILIQREAFGLKSDENNIKPKYIEYANKYGFRWEPFGGIGFIQYDHKANLIMELIKQYSKNLVSQIGFPIYQVSGSNLFDMNYPAVDAYAKLFGDRLFKFEDGDKKLIMSYDASYPQFNLASKYNLSYKNLPFGHFSVSDCYRHEQSGECMLLFRGRRFFMPDLHPYFESVKSAFVWYPQIEKQILKAAHMGKRDYENIIKVSSNKYFNQYQKEIKQIALRRKKPVLVEIREEERYWIIDVDYSIVDNLKQVREIGCIQIDIGNAERLGIKFKDKHSKEKNPVIIHAAVPGGLERFLYMLFDNFEEFPLWLKPVHLRLLPVSQKFNDFCISLANEYKNKLRIEIDDKNEPVNRKVKRAYHDLVEEVIVIGDKEIHSPSSIIKKLELLANNIKEYPFQGLSWPNFLSKQI